MYTLCHVLPPVDFQLTPTPPIIVRVVIECPLISDVTRFGICIPTTYLHYNSIHFSMASLLAQTVAQPPKWRFFHKNLSQLVIFVIGLVFTWSQVDKNKAPIFRKQTTSTNEVLPKGFYHKMFYWQSNNLNRNKNQNDTTDFWHRKLTLKIKFWWSSQRKFNHKNN